MKNEKHRYHWFNKQCRVSRQYNWIQLNVIVYQIGMKLILQFDKINNTFV